MGRDWLARQLQHAGIGYKQRDNCFVDVEDLAQAQHLLQTQVEAHWERLLTDLARRIHPVHERLYAHGSIPYYWSLEESEWATDAGVRVLGLGLLPGTGVGIPAALKAQLDIAASKSCPVDTLVILWPRGANLAPPAHELFPGTAADAAGEFDKSKRRIC